MTRIFDDPATFSDEALAGFVAANRSHVAAIDGGVIRATELMPGQVALVIGGGAGHYPAFAGLVGPGLAAGAACGNLFSSPASGQVYRVAEASQTGGGVLLSYGNYAGDVLHFGRAQENLNAAGIETRTVLVTDDIASAPLEHMQDRRGIAGDLTVFKIAGAAADAGLSLDEVERLARAANFNTRSLGVAFSGCTLPGAPAPLFDVPPGKMSLGLGIHGEPGISEQSMPTASALADLLVSRLLREKPVGSGARVVPILNGLGTVKYDELFLLFGKVEALLVEAGLEIIEPECGELVTSLDMSGLSLTLFWLTDELEKYWRAPADAPGYSKGATPARAPRPRPSVEGTASAPVPSIRPVATLAAADLGAAAALLLQTARTVVVTHEDEWGLLDAFAGDGDHGIGMRRGVEAALDAATRAATAGAGIDTVLLVAGEAWSEKAGGTSGALWGSAIIAMGQSLGNRIAYGPDDVLAAIQAFTHAIIELGQAELGDKTMVDALIPFANSFTEQHEAGTSSGPALNAAAATAMAAATATAALTPRKGRARPLAAKSIGHADPGAVSFGLIAAGIAQSVTDRARTLDRARTGEGESHH